MREKHIQARSLSYNEISNIFCFIFFLPYIMTISVERVPYIFAVVMAFVAWGLLYSPMMLESAWKKAGNLSDAAMQHKMWHKLLVSALLRVVQVYILIHMIWYMARIEWLDSPTIILAIQTAFWMRLWFSAIAHLQENLWKENIAWKLFAINSFSTLLMLIAGGVVYVWLARIM